MARTLGALALAALVCLLGGSPAAGQAPAPQAPSLVLVGTVIRDGGEPMAILEDSRTHEQELYPLGATIGNVRLTRILRDRVVLTSGGSDMEIRLARPSSLPPGGPLKQAAAPPRHGGRRPSNPLRPTR
jgi:hypothetical protein